MLQALQGWRCDAVAAVVRRQAVVVEIVAWGLMVPLPRRAVAPWCVGGYGLYFCCCCRFYCCSNALASSSSRAPHYYNMSETYNPRRSRARCRGGTRRNHGDGPLGWQHWYCGVAGASRCLGLVILLVGGMPAVDVGLLLR
mmetsp:Transcript_6032/g.11290  ORF Transcript_6032/g.11290 Transcript_6032/m.11290 type:complete len:141 (-) Transcript_6032:66-488(-)